MKLSKKQRREEGRWQPLERANLVQKTPAEIDLLVSGLRRNHPGYSEEKIREIVTAAQNEFREIWKNDRYQVHVIHWPPLEINGRDYPIVQLSIRRNDRAPARDWRDFQRIKDQLIGPECEAIELYPARSRVVDLANQFHCWAVADPSFRFPFGYTKGVTSDDSYAGAVQRPIEAG